MRYHFTAKTESTDRDDLKGLFERHVAELWIPAHLLPSDAAGFALDHFQRTVLGDLEMLVVECRREAKLP